MEDLPPGYRFYPTEDELVEFYLQKKLDGMRAELDRVMERVIPTLDIYEFNPWDLPQLSGEACQRDHEQWFFFIPRNENAARGGRPKRLTTFGYWKATGSPGYVYSSSHRIVGLKRTMVYYKGRAPNGNKTDWKMNEYKVLEGGSDYDLPNNSSIIPHQLRQEYSLCRLYKKSKNLRAFDRRPTTGGRGLNYQSAGQILAGDLNCDEITKIVPPDPDQHHRHQYHPKAVNYIINPPLEVERRILIDSSSPNGSPSSGENGHRDRRAEYCGNGEVMMLPVNDIDPLWDWINT